MRRRTIAVAFILACVTVFTAGVARAQDDGWAEKLSITAAQATTWSEGESQVVQLRGPLRIVLDDTTMTAQEAVVWLTPVSGGATPGQRVQIALLGDATITQPGARRAGPQMLVTAQVRGAVRLTTNQRDVSNLAAGPTYRRALALRPDAQPAAAAPLPTPQSPWLQPPPLLPQPAAVPAAAAPPAPGPVQTVSFSGGDVNFIKTTDGLVAIVVLGGVKLIAPQPNGDLLELQAQSAVLFTTLTDLRQLNGAPGAKKGRETLTAAYLEGGVQIVHTLSNAKVGEQRLWADRVYYDFPTDRAILTDAVMHTLDPKTQTPVVVRAQILRQLSSGEFQGQHVQLTMSTFHTPSYAIAMRQAYVREVDSGDPRYGLLTYYEGHDVTLNLNNVPLVYTPYAAGSFTEHGSLLRDVELGDSTRLGFNAASTWGLFETFGQLPPPDTDAAYKVDYFADRGPALELEGHYAGGFVTEATREPWSFQGDLQAFIISDHGDDSLGGDRNLVVPPEQLRGRLFWEHTQYLPDDWEVQFSTAYISDATFMSEWFANEFDTSRPRDTSFYAKHQDQTEAVTLLASLQPIPFPTSSELLQEQFAVQREPEIGYHRIGDAVGSDGLTFFSDDSAAALSMRPSDVSLAKQGFVPGYGPGLPSVGQTGINTSTVYRGDLRQELDYPFAIGELHFLPYAMARDGLYSNSPTGQQEDRLYEGAGLRVNTSFWEVDDSVESDLLDIHRLRHVIEPEAQVFTSASSKSPQDLYIYDESVDDINDISAVQLGLDQSWQTKRGGPDRWRSVDVFTFDVQANFFLHKPSNAQLMPDGFRGLYYDSLPEASIPRDGINADTTWRISDTTAVLGDAQYNMDQRELATASLGVAAQRDTRVGFFVGARYIGQINSSIITVAGNYQLTPTYTVSALQSFDVSTAHSVATNVSLVRQFDRFFFSVSLSYDEVANVSGVMVNLWPQGLGAAPPYTFRQGLIPAP